MFSRRWPHALLIGAAGSILATGLIAGPGMKQGEASNHVDAPTQILDPQNDVSDFYAFTSPDKPDTVTFIWNYIPLQLPNIPLPWYRFMTEGYYDLHIDNDGDAQPDLTYRWWYRNGDGSGDPKAQPTKVHPNLRPELAQYTMGRAGKRAGKRAEPKRKTPEFLTAQTYRLELLRPGRPAKTLLDNVPIAPQPLISIGQSYDKLRRDATVALPGGGATFSGVVKDPFFFDIRIGTALGIGAPIPLPVDFIIPFNCHSIAIQIPKSTLALNNDVARNPVIGTWATSHRKTLNLSGGAPAYRQVSRIGLAMFSSVVLPITMRDRYHLQSTPATDPQWKGMHAILRNNPLQFLLAPTTLTVPPPTTRTDLTQIWLHGIHTKTGPIKVDLNSHLLNKDVGPSQVVPSEQLRLNMSTPVTARPNRFGLLGGDLQGYPNGRRLNDDTVVGITRFMMGEPVYRKVPPLTYLSTIVLGPFKPITSTFPYVADPDIR